MPPRILVLTTSYPRTADDDAGIFVERLVHAFSKTGLAGVVAVPKDEKETLESTGEFAIRRFEYGFLSHGALAFGAGILPNIKRNPFLLFQAPDLILGFLRMVSRERRKVDLIHANWLFAGLAAWIANLLWKMPYVLTLRGEDVRLLHVPVLSFFLNQALNKAAAITAVNKQFLDSLSPTQREKALCIANGVNASATQVTSDFVCSEFHLDPKAKYLLYVGRVIELKSIETLIESLIQLPDYSLILCGRLGDECYIKILRELITKHALENRVQFTGGVSPQLIPQFMTLAKFYVTASTYEGRSNSILEALAAGLVVLASDIPSHRESIIDKENGYLFPVKDGMALSELVKHISSSEDLYNKVSGHGRQYAQQFSWESCATQYSELFNKVVPNILGGGYRSQ